MRSVFYEAELYRLKGELLRQLDLELRRPDSQSHMAEVEECFHRPLRRSLSAGEVSGTTSGDEFGSSVATQGKRTSSFPDAGREPMAGSRRVLIPQTYKKLKPCLQLCSDYRCRRLT